MHLEPGEQIHHYVVEARVGGGGTATVYRVRHAILQHALALKVLDDRHVARPDLRQLFLAEGRIQASVRHPAIVMVTDAVVDAPRRIAGLVMEYVEGPDLSELIARFTAPPSTALVRSLAIPILEALNHAHGEGIVHRDVKPSNVLLSRDASGVWHPRVADFGIAYALHAGLKDGRRGLGTPAFMCPEQLQGGEPSVQWDVFAFGCLLHELATGVHPFEQEEREATEQAILTGPPVDPSAIRDDLDPVIAEAIRSALARDPADRAPDCKALLDLLARSSSDLPNPAPPPAPDPATPPPTASIPPSFLETSTGPEHARRAWRLTQARVRVGRNDVEVALGPNVGLETVHCVLRWDGRRWVLENRASTGTRVNGARVTSIPLEDGDLLRVGHDVLKFHTTVMPDVAPPPPRGRRGPRLVVPGQLLASGEPAVVPITTAPLVIGRGPGADLEIREPAASARHCQVTLQGMDVIIEDLGSNAGTTVDDHPVRFRKLDDGAVIRIGGATLRFRG